jgi:hypothetical protein
MSDNGFSMDGGTDGWSEFMVCPQPTTELLMGFKMDDALMDGWFYALFRTCSWIIMGFQMDGALTGEWIMVHPQSIDES